MKKVLIIIVAIVVNLSADFSFGDMFKDIKKEITINDSGDRVSNSIKDSNSNIEVENNSNIRDKNIKR